MTTLNRKKYFNGSINSCRFCGPWLDRKKNLVFPFFSACSLRRWVRDDQAPVSSFSTLFSFSFASKYSSTRELKSQQTRYLKIQQQFFFSFTCCAFLCVCLHDISTLNWRHSLFLHLKILDKKIFIHHTQVITIISRECSIFLISLGFYCYFGYCIVYMDVMFYIHVNKEIKKRNAYTFHQCYFHTSSPIYSAYWPEEKTKYQNTYKLNTLWTTALLFKIYWISSTWWW